MKCGFVSLIGRPSSGKSTLINSLCGHKVAITSPKPQTTRNIVRGVSNQADSQIIFLDTPGFHDSQHAFNRTMLRSLSTALEDSDLILYLLDTSRKLGSEERALAEFINKYLAKSGKPLLIVFNKSDLEIKYTRELEAYIKDNFKFLNSQQEVKLIHISARYKLGLGALLEVLSASMPESEKLYPDDIYTDQDPEFRITELIREQSIYLTGDEIPHSIYVEIADTHWLDENTLEVRSFIKVEKESQKGMLVGKAGHKIRSIRKRSEAELRRIFPYKVKLDLRVKVDHKWRKKTGKLNKMFS